MVAGATKGHCFIGNHVSRLDITSNDYRGSCDDEE